MKKIQTDLKYLSLIWIALALLLIPTYAHHGHLILDCGREVYYPTQIILGKVLYKDIFNIYGPFAYMFNALLFKLFGVNLNVLYAAGIACAGLISSLIYLISKRFLPKFLSFSIAIFTVSIGVLNVNLFNFIFPYSYSILYGLLAFLTSVWLLLKYQSSPEKPLYLYFSCFFAGLCFVNKYEFLPYLAVILYSIIKIKPVEWDDNTTRIKPAGKPSNLLKYYYTILALLFIPILCFGTLFLQGLRLEDLKTSFVLLYKIANSETLKYFYYTQGVYFTKHTISLLVVSFLKTAAPLGILLLGFRAKNEFASFFAVGFSICLMAFLTNPASFAFLPVLIIILSIWNFKSLKENQALLILTLSAILISLKSLWGLATLNYGAFFISFLLIAAMALIVDKFKDKNINLTAVGVFILVIATTLGMQNFPALSAKTQLVKTSRGEIYTDKYIFSATSELLNYIKTSTKKTDTIAIFPEGLFINFLADRKSDDYYNSLIPLYTEVFGEEKLIRHFEKTKPDYIIFNNWDNKDYYFSYICTDYAVSFCNYIAQNYTEEKVIDQGFRYLIFKHKRISASAPREHSAE